MLSVRSNASKNSNRRPGLWLGLSGWLAPGLALAQQSEEKQPIGNPTDLLTLGLSLVVVIGVIYALAYILKRMNVSHTGNRQIKIVASAAMGTRERVCVIEVAGNQYLLGVTANNINHLATLDAPLTTAGESGSVKFKQRLSQFMNAQTTAPVDKESGHG